ncbi:DUF6468 domain-containing protein [Novispirillum itersonii]|uniref:DUF6468 domain-containing protein n=1 Tax=Novispirillum itersonii TaxID=189 RepID=UPI000367F54F|nr:DUF6468 domain-containing protein [Novispirillum itersonii]
MTVSLILDVVVVALLVPTIVFAVILNSRLSALRKNREELGRLIAAFNEATLRAESGIPRLRKASEEASKALQERVERAQLLRDDLAFMVERAGQAADRLEGAVRNARDHAPAPAGATPPTAPAPVSTGRAATPPAFMDVESAAAAAERVAMEAVAAATKAAAAEVPLTAAPELRPRPSAMASGSAPAPSRPQAPAARPSGTRTAAPPAPTARPARSPAPSLGAALASEAPASGPSSPKVSFGDDERSEAERELLRALQSAR